MMDLAAGSYVFGLLAGILSTLSPCVLPLIPLVAGAALGAHRYGIFALAIGLTASFTVVGLMIATAGFAIGLDGDQFRLIGALLMGALGVLLVSSRLQERFAGAAGGISGAGERLLLRIQPEGLRGQFLIGALLGIVWSPCVGPTLGAVSLVAGQRQHLIEASGIMLLFGIGAALPLVAIGSIGRGAMGHWRERLSLSGRFGKALLGSLLLVLAAFVATGADKRVEALLVEISPAWLSELTTRF